MAADQHAIGHRLLPPRFLAFCLVALVAVPAAIVRAGWSTGTMIGFDVAAALFLAICLPLLRESSADAMRASARRNDANRVALLVIASFASIAVLASIAAELGARGEPEPGTVALVVATLILSWLFGNTVYALHYAHLYYLAGEEGGDAQGLDVPATPEPDYWDFLYFAFTLGMTFQTSDVALCTRQMRRVATAHTMAAFVFNLGIVAFTINVLGGR
jgi:uncharacterized membrane protein